MNPLVFLEEVATINSELLTYKYGGLDNDDVIVQYQQHISAMHAQLQKALKRAQNMENSTQLDTLSLCYKEATITLEFANELLEGYMNTVGKLSGGGVDTTFNTSSTGMIILSNYAAGGNMKPLLETVTTFVNNIPTLSNKTDVIENIAQLNGVTSTLEFQHAIGQENGVLDKFFQKIAHQGKKNTHAQVLQSLRGKWEDYLNTIKTDNYECIGDRIFI